MLDKSQSVETFLVDEDTHRGRHTGGADTQEPALDKVLCGENSWGSLDMQHAIDAEASDYMMPDVMKIGGVTGWLCAAAFAQTKGIRLSSHLWPEISAQLLCVTPTAHWLKYADWWNPVIREPLQIKNGMADVSEVSGTGVDWNEDAVVRFSV